MTCWLQQAYQELSDARTATENSSFAEKCQVRQRSRAESIILCCCTAIVSCYCVHQVFQNLTDSFTEQRRPVMTLLAAIRRRPELSQEQRALRTAWDRLEEEVRVTLSTISRVLVTTVVFISFWCLCICECLIYLFAICYL